MVKMQIFLGFTADDTYILYNYQWASKGDFHVTQTMSNRIKWIFAIRQHKTYIQEV